MIIGCLNLTQHPATVEQITAGVVEPSPELKEMIRKLLTFEENPDSSTIIEKAMILADIADEHGYAKAMIGGAGFLMAALEYHLNKRGVVPCYSFSKRVSEEWTDEDGNILKKSTFKHIGFTYPTNRVCTCGSEEPWVLCLQDDPSWCG